MSEQALQYWLELGERRYAVRVTEGHESLSALFRFDLTFVVDPTDELDPDSILRVEAALLLVRRSEVRRITGMVSRATRKATRRSGVNAGGGEVKITLEPKLALLGHRVDLHVFRPKSVPEIVREVLEVHGVGCDNRLRGKYKTREYCVQLRESDLDFIHRLLEDEGIFYFIDEAGAVVLGDTAQAYDDSIGLLPFRMGAGLDDQEDSISAMGRSGTMTAGSVSLRDFNPVHPRMNMDVNAEGPTADGAEWYDYPGEYDEPSEGNAKAKLRAEALRCVHHRAFGRSFSGALRPGVIFHVTGTPPGVPEGGYVVTRTTHRHDLTKEGFELGFEGLPEDVVYRPEVKTPIPVLLNPLTGFVTGPAGADIHTNEWGQVKVWFPWDRVQPKDDTCSHWIPVLQDNTGHSSAISRTRWEVLCHFMEGDPDRPVVMGRVFNGADPFYSPLPERKARSALRSMVSPRSDDYETLSNYIQFDDDAGVEGIFVHAQKDQNVVVLNDKHEQIDNTDHRIVRGDETIKVGNDHTVQTKKDLEPTISGSQTRDVGGDHSLGVGSTLSEAVNKDHRLTISGDHTRQMGVSDGLLVAKNITEKIQGSVLEVSVKSNTVAAEKTSTLHVGGSLTEIAKGNKTNQAGLGKLEDIGENVLKKANKFMATRTEMLRRSTISKFFAVRAVKEILVAGIEKLVKQTKSASYEGAQDVTLKVGETQIEMAKGRIEFSAVKKIVFKTSAVNNLALQTATQIKAPLPKPAAPATPPAQPPKE